MTPEERDRLIHLKQEMETLQDSLGVVIKVVSDRIIENLKEITEIRGETKAMERINKMRDCNGNTEVT